MVCDDIPGLDKVMLAQCKFHSSKGEIISVQGDLAEQIVRGLKLSVLADSRIVSARFRVKFADSKADRMVTVKAGNQAEFKYDDDGRKIEQWLTQRGFKHSPNKERR